MEAVDRTGHDTGDNEREEGFPVCWHEQTPAFRRWLASHPGTSARFLRTGREAEIWCLSNARGPRFVLKRFTRFHHISARRQFVLLRHLGAMQLPVPEPAGWGADYLKHQVLATRYAGPDIRRATGDQVQELGRILAGIHQTSAGATPFLHTVCGIDETLARRFPRLAGHEDVLTILGIVTSRITETPARLVHGDFHLGNALLERSRLVIADWSEAGMGDFRYDLAWACVLMLLYSGEPSYERFLASYRAAFQGELDPGSLSQFEVIAGLRWIVLVRLAPLPVEREKIALADRFVRARLPRALGSLLREPPGA